MTAGVGMVVGDAGRSAAYETADAAGLVADLEAELHAYTRQTGFAAAAISEPRTALALQPLEDRGWWVLHDRLWPGSTRATIDHLVIRPTRCGGGRHQALGRTGRAAPRPLVRPGGRPP